MPCWLPKVSMFCSCLLPLWPEDAPRTLLSPLAEVYLPSKGCDWLQAGGDTAASCM